MRVYLAVALLCLTAATADARPRRHHHIMRLVITLRVPIGRARVAAFPGADVGSGFATASATRD